ncbi:unnamed protein product [Acanthosepion pharaonis]|uniref:CCHC-type domain-containing protein n=1 Tax=Acanthosepion pharaonis TaxID=158019 RepID=A0A812DNC9_ACAPH|nr:unnamed protein product [Sepia pharaonis]
MWFAQTEAIFQAKHIHSQTARYTYIVKKLQPEITADVLDLLEAVLTHSPFDIQKEAIIYHTGKLHERRLHDLFNTIQLGDSRPSLRHMKNLLGKNSMSESLFHKLWLDKLPPHTSQILATLHDDLDLSKTAEIADKINDVSTISSVDSPVPTDAAMMDIIEQLKQQLERLSTQRLIDEALRGLHHSFAYIDDLLIASANMGDHARHRQLSDSTTKLSNRRIISQLTSTELRIAVPRDNSLQDILDKFPSLIQPFTYTEPVKHNTVHRIRTTKQPVYSKPRRLAPDKYEIARAEFQHMLNLGIICPSSSPYASPLHMVTKAQQGAWRPCAYKDAVQREGEVIQMQLAEFFTDAIENSFVREDTARAYPTTLTEAFNAAQQSLRLHERLATSREQMWGARGQGDGRYIGPPQNDRGRWRYGGTDHHWGNHTPQRSWTESRPVPGRPGCWGCGRLGHLMRECPRQEGPLRARKETERQSGNAEGPPRGM